MPRQTLQLYSDTPTPSAPALGIVVREQLFSTFTMKDKAAFGDVSHALYPLIVRRSPFLR